MISTKDFDQPVERFMQRKFPVLAKEDTVTRAAEVMKDNSVGSIVVASDGEPVGIVTEQDVLFKVVAEGIDPSKTPLEQIMSRSLISISAKASVAEAIALMAKNKIRRLAVTEDGRLVGMIYQLVLSGDVPASVTPLPELQLPSGVRCPYCGSAFPEKNTLSKHIDRLHIGSGLLEGDTRQW